jgi:hypothetical protein
MVDFMVWQSGFTPEIPLNKRKSLSGNKKSSSRSVSDKETVYPHFSGSLEFFTAMALVHAHEG